MIPRLLSLACLSLSLLVSAPIIRAESPGKSVKTVRLLTVGNSFSGNATQYLKDVAKAGGHVLIYRTCSIGGSTMAQHWAKVEQHEADANDPRGLYSSKRSLKQELTSEPWDFVTIQQASIRSHDVATYRPFARQLHDFIKKQAPKAEVLLHQTWAYRRDDPRFIKPSEKAGEPATQQAMHEGLTNAYNTIAAELGVRVILVGDAFCMADTDPAWGYQPDSNFDRQTAIAPALPNQKHSLHTGWKWGTKDGKSSLSMDGHHANTAGQYLGACVFYEVLFRENVVGNSFVPRGLDPADAKYLQETAHKAVASRQAKQPAAAQ